MIPGRNIAVSPSRRGWRSGLLILGLIVVILLPATGAHGDEKTDRQAKERLAWMRENQTGMWNISPREGLYLYDLVTRRHLKRGLEIGTSNGYSGIWIAAGMRSTGGHLLTLEINEERAELAQDNFRAAGLERFVTLEHCGCAPRSL